MCNIIQVADAADVIVNGYAFTKAGNNVQILNRLGEVLETEMG